MLRKLLRSFIGGFFENASVNQLAASCALGFAAGIMPKANLLAKLLGLSMVILRVNLATAMLVAALFTLLGPIFHVIAHPIGLWLLTAPTLRGVWTALYNMPLVPWTAFNDTVVLGSLVLGLIFFMPVFVLARNFFRKHRRETALQFLRMPLVQRLRATRFMRWYLGERTGRRNA
jgi:uncharacterized protein (TIGR03546 family)